MEQQQEEDLQEIQEKIEKLERLTKENNRILHKMQNHIRLGTIMRVLYWVVIIGVMLGIYHYLQPFMEQMLGTYNEIIGIPEKLKNLNPL
jgi:uncharacterized membrane protein YccF (DUF307 family)